MINFAEETENTETTNNETENNSTTNNSGADDAKSTEPATVTEDAGEIPKPGGKKEKNPKKSR